MIGKNEEGIEIYQNRKKEEAQKTKTKVIVFDKSANNCLKKVNAYT